jgi:hypothetical protein
LVHVGSAELLRLARLVGIVGPVQVFARRVRRGYQLANGHVGDASVRSGFDQGSFIETIPPVSSNIDISNVTGFDAFVQGFSYSKSLAVDGLRISASVISNVVSGMDRACSLSYFVISIRVYLRGIGNANRSCQFFS